MYAAEHWGCYMNTSDGNLFLKWMSADAEPSRPVRIIDKMLRTWLGKQLRRFWKDRRSLTVRIAENKQTYTFREFLEWYGNRGIARWSHAKSLACNKKKILLRLLSSEVRETMVPSSASEMPFHFAFVHDFQY